MTYIEINGVRYAVIRITGTMSDSGWDNRESRTILLNMSYEEAYGIFFDNMAWSIVATNQFSTPKKDANGNIVVDVDGNIVYEEGAKEDVFDCSAFCVAGPITNNRDGTVTVKMGKMTALEEAYEIILGGLRDE